MRIIHIADIHFRGMSRHNEYRRAFTKFFEKARVLDPDVIYVGGDIVHSKTQGISPEVIDILNWWFTSLADIAPVHVILGNHDGLILNKDRQDAITPILSALNNENIFLYKKSGVYPTGIDGFNWCVFSCFDEDGWERVNPIAGDVNIAFFHGGVHGSKTDINWNIDGEVDCQFFERFDYALLGDIHKQQFLNDEKTIAYCGSSIQQNYGEDTGKGFLLWDIEDKRSFNVSFHEIPHDQPFVTIDWKGSIQETVAATRDHEMGARYRVRSESQINQVELKQLYNELKHVKKASEVVFKHDTGFDISVIAAGDTVFNRDDLRDSNTHKKLIRSFTQDSDIEPEAWEKIDDIIDRYLGKITSDDVSVRNIKWNIKSLEFNNTFGYGKDNKINFDSLPGITGIFGKNRSGKSSIIGTLMYALFNTTDRGSIKNLHIINTRKGQCSASVTLNANGKNYRIERQSVKHQTRSGKFHATTYLGAYRIDSNGEIISDITEEQRRESEKIVRKLIGTSEDFLMTSLASQGEMNTFIKEKATQRKAILSNFLDLNIFDKMTEMIKEESYEIKALIKNAPDRDWTHTIESLSQQKLKNVEKIKIINDALEKKTTQLQDLKITIATHKDKDLVTKEDIDKKEIEIKIMKDKIHDHKNNIQELSSLISDRTIKLEKIQSVKNQFPIDELKNQLDEQKNAESDLLELEHQHDKEKTLLSTQKKSIKKLQEVPCGDSFPTCKFIKDSYKNKSLIFEQEERVSNLSRAVRSLKKSLKTLREDFLEEKIERYNDIIAKESDLKILISEDSAMLHESRVNAGIISEQILEHSQVLQGMRLRVKDADISSEIIQIRNSISMLEEDIRAHDSNRISLTEKSGRISNELKKARDEFEKYKKLKREWRIYEILNQAFSKKGIPLQIITSQLPIINAEISKILQDNVGFTVELDADLDSNAMDVYINYVDSRRVIELASGMEKMMASLAIRVALINVSTLPKTDMLIIDEGFGALDEMNLESCNRLLQSLKRWFKHILIISHVDAVKDVVDNVLDISMNGKDAKVVCE